MITFRIDCIKSLSKTSGKPYVNLLVQVVDVESNKILTTVCNYFPKPLEAIALETYGLVEDRTQYETKETKESKK